MQNPLKINDFFPLEYMHTSKDQKKKKKNPSCNKKSGEKVPVVVSVKT